MSFDLVMKSACEGCGSTSDLYGTGCRHTTLCTTCAKAKCAERERCIHCGTPITKLIREYGVRASASADKLYIGRFVTGLPPFSKKKNAENKWSLQKEGLQGRQVTDALREKYKNKPWVLEDETGQHQYQGQVEGAQAATYYLLMLQGKEFLATPAGTWFNFNKVAQYKQLTLEEAEEKMNKRKNNATGYERWMMKAATNGPAVFGGQVGFDVKKGEGVDSGGADGNRPRKGKNNTDGDHSDKGEEDEEEEGKRKNRLGLNKKGQDDDEEGGQDDDFDLEDEIEKGDDWEHEETFTDDDETNNIEPDPEDMAPEIPAPPEIKQDDEDEEDDDNEEEGGLSKSGKELKKLLGKAAGLIETGGPTADDDGQNENAADDEDDDDEENNTSPVLSPKKKDASKDENMENTPAKTASSSRGTPSTAKSSKGKRKTGIDDAKNANAAPAKKAKSDNEPKLSVKEEQPTSSKVSATPKAAVATSSKAEQSAPTGPVTEDEIRTALLKVPPMTTQDLVALFKTRLKCQKDKSAFADILRKISKIQKTNGQSYVVLRERQ